MLSLVEKGAESPTAVCAKLYIIVENGVHR